MITKNTKPLLGLLALALTSQAYALPITLDFEGIGNLANIEDFYNGGTDSQGNAGTDFGVSFSGNTLGIIDSDAGGTGNIANEPSGETVMFFLESDSAIMNFAAGFDTGFSFFYSSAEAAIVNIWDGLNATGNLIASINLIAQFDNNCVGDPNGTFCNWDAIGTTFDGIAMSIDFGGAADFTAYDDVTFGAATPGPGQVPEPAMLVLLGMGLFSMGISRRFARNQ